MRQTIFLLCILCVFNLAETEPADESTDSEKILSPYFIVKSDDVAVDALPLKGTTATVEIAGVIASVKVQQIYENKGTIPLEALYVFPGSSRAAVYGMTMTIGDRKLVASARARDVARKSYEQAKKQGKSASLLEQNRPNVFQMNVANILPGDLIVVELHYVELLVPTDGVYEFVYPTVVGPRYSTKPESAPVTEQWLAQPYTKEKELPSYTFDISVSLSGGMPLQDVRCESHKVNLLYKDPNSASLTLADTEKFQGNRDVIIKYSLAGGEIQSGLLLSKGVDENFFLLMVQPPRRLVPSQIVPREYIFIIDVSGSMNGFPLDVSKRLMRDLLGGLKPHDTFNIILFAGSSALLAEKSLPASAANIEQAIQLVDSHQGGGGTELLPALKRALAIPPQEGFSRNFVLVTDGYVAVEAEAFDLVRNNLKSANFFAFGIGSAVNRFLIEGLARVGLGEPFIVTTSSEAPTAASKFREYISSPILNDIQVQFVDFKTYDIEPLSFPDLFAERPLLIYGKWKGTAQGTITVSGQTAAGIFQKQFEVKQYSPNEKHSALRYLWARQKITLLSDYNGQFESEELKKQITELGLTYNLLTKYTSFVAIDTMVRRTDENLTSVKQPVPLPQGVSNLGVGGQNVPATPEPETWALMAVVATLLVWGLFMGRLR
jgi:Ca-activated chloride channel family protein